ncbi:MAG: nuclear transport factor 2 family protein [Fimbriimonadales bacterium]
MKHLKIISIIAIALTQIAAANASARSEIEAVYAKFAHCGKTRDMKGAIALLHTSYHGSDLDGHEANYKQTVDMMRSMIGDTKDIQMNFDIKQVQQYGEEVSAWVTMRVRMMIKQGGKWSPMEYTGHFVECLKKFDGKWKFIRSYEVKSL